MVNSFGARATIKVGDRAFDIFRLDALEKHGIKVQRLPFSLRILLENLLRHEDGRTVTADDIRALGAWDPKADPDKEIAFMPSRVVLQDFTGVPAVVDLASMRDAMVKLGGDPNKINPLQPVDLVVDHSVQVDFAGSPDALEKNAELEFRRNQERYAFLRWGQSAFRNFRLVPPATGIVHQVNLEYLARVVFTTDDNPSAPKGERPVAYPDTVIGTDSHTTMINGLGVLGWGVGGIEAEAAMLGQPLSMLIPQVVGFRLTGKLPAGATATDLVLTVTQMLRKKGVVGKFVEFFGPGALSIPLADRATIANMAPEYGATCGIFPVDPATIRFLELTGRPRDLCQLVEAYFREQHLFGEEAFADAQYSDVLELDLATVEPCLAGPKRPQDRLTLKSAKAEWQKALSAISSAATGKKALPQAATGLRAPEQLGFDPKSMKSGDVVIAAITSCTNTSNPSVLLAAGLVAQKAAARGLFTKPWVKTSLAPGSKSVPDYLRAAGVLDALEQQRFHVVGYGCTTCLASGTPVLLANGTSRRIERMPTAGGALLFSPDEQGELNLSVQREAISQGRRACITLTLQDGRELVCTPDHELLCEGGRWVRADQLVPGEDRVLIGLDAPLDEPGEEERSYVLQAGDLLLSAGDAQERARLLAFARLLGHLLGDGSISANGQGRMNAGQALDREVILNDIEVLTGKRPVATMYDERKWAIVLPKELTDAISSLEGVRTGRRVEQAPTIPGFLLDERCPVAVLREFLGGLFGADGHAPILKRYGEGDRDGSLEQPAYAQSVLPGFVSEQKQAMQDLLRLLSRCGVETQEAKIYEFPVRRSDSSYPAPQDGTERVEVRLELPDGLSFVERVGFRYCVDKMLRASAAAVYWRTVERIERQRLWMAGCIDMLHREHPDLSFSKVRELAAERLRRREAIIFPHYSLLEGHDRFDRLPTSTQRPFRPLHRENCGFPSPAELFEQLGVRNWFAPLLPRKDADFSKRYCVEKTSNTLPTFSLQVLDRRDAGEQEVFDLAVDGTSSFVAGTFCVHNCIGNSGPLSPEVSAAIGEKDLVVTSVLSGNRNFEGRVHPEVKANYLASPPLVVVYALAGTMDIDFETEPVGTGSDGKPVFLKDIWPTHQEVADAEARAVTRELYERAYSDVFAGDARWQAIQAPAGETFTWNDASTYVKRAPYFDGMGKTAPGFFDVKGARVLAFLGDSITTDHISPAGNIKAQSPAGKYLQDRGVTPEDFNQYGARRGNHEVMVRGTFANIRLRNRLTPQVEGGVTRVLPGGTEVLPISDAAEKYQAAGVSTIILAGKEYGSGSSRDWAAKGPMLQGVKAVIAESFERIHRSNLVGMGVIPLQFRAGESAESLGLTGEEVFDIQGLAQALSTGFAGGREVPVVATLPDGSTRTFHAVVRVDTPQEIKYIENGGILPYVLRQLAFG